MNRFYLFVLIALVYTSITRQSVADSIIHFATNQTLRDACEEKRDDPQYTFCLGYISGIMQMMTLSQGYNPLAKPEIKACWIDIASRSDLIDIVSATAEAISQNYSDPDRAAGLFIIEYVKDHYCK